MFVMGLLRRAKACFRGIILKGGSTGEGVRVKHNIFNIFDRQIRVVLASLAVSAIPDY